MADIFLSYTRTDATRAGQLAEQLEARGLTVFWDTEVLPGQRWRDVIHEELDDALCVIVVWSSESSQSRWVVEEASEALEAGKLVPVLLDGTLPPFGFRGVEAANLAGWTPGAASVEFENLVSAVRQIVDAAPTAEIVAPDPLPADQDVEAASSDGVSSGDGAEVSSGDGAEVASDPEPAATGDAKDRSAGSDDTTTVIVEGTPGPDLAVRTPDVDGVRPESMSGDAVAGDPVTRGAGDSHDDQRAMDTAASAASTRRETSPPVIDPEPPPPLPPGIVARLGTGGLAAVGVAAVLIVVLIVVLSSGGQGGNGPGTTIAGGSTTSGATTTSTQGEIVESDTVTAFRTATPPAIDGDLGEWANVAELSHLRQEVFRDPDVTDRLGEDSPGVVAARYDDAALYLAVASQDDVYSQLNTGNQIWRGDALDINLTTAPAGAISERPDGDDFQLTMTPRDADGRAATVWFTGNGSGFSDNSTGQPVTLAGAVDPGGSWVLEAAIPWSVFGLSGPPGADLAALVAVFDNDGEVVDGAPQQTVILGHTEAEFQRPLTWGTLRLEP